MLTRQLGLLRACMGDECPAIRVHAIEGMCHALNLFWEIIPAATSAMFITKLTGKQASLVQPVVCAQSCFTNDMGRILFVPSFDIGP